MALITCVPFMWATVRRGTSKEGPRYRASRTLLSDGTQPRSIHRKTVPDGHADWRVETPLIGRR